MKYKLLSLFIFGLLFNAKLVTATDVAPQAALPQQSEQSFFAYYRDKFWSTMGKIAGQCAVDAIDPVYFAAAEKISDLAADAVAKAVFDLCYADNSRYTELNGQKLKHYYYKANLINNLLGIDFEDLVKTATKPVPLIDVPINKVIKLVEDYVASKILPKLAKESVKQLTLEALLYAKGYCDEAIRKKVEGLFVDANGRDVKIAFEPKDKSEDVTEEELEKIKSFTFENDLTFSNVVANRITNPIIEKINEKVEQEIRKVIEANAVLLTREAITSLSFYISDTLIAAPMIYIAATGIAATGTAATGTAATAAVWMMGVGLFMFRNESQLADAAGRQAAKIGNPLAKMLSAPLKFEEKKLNEYRHVVVKGSDGGEFIVIEKIDYSFGDYLKQFLPGRLKSQSFVPKMDEVEFDLNQSYTMIDKDTLTASSMVNSMVVITPKDDSTLTDSFVFMDLRKAASTVLEDSVKNAPTLTQVEKQAISDLFASAVVVPSDSLNFSKSTVDVQSNNNLTDSTFEESAVVMPVDKVPNNVNLTDSDLYDNTDNIPEEYDERSKKNDDKFYGELVKKISSFFKAIWRILGGLSSG